MFQGKKLLNYGIGDYNMDYKEAIEKVIHWREGYEEVIFPEIMLYLAAVIHDDPDAEEFRTLAFDQGDKFHLGFYRLYEKMDKKYGKYIYGEEYEPLDR